MRLQFAFMLVITSLALSSTSCRSLSVSARHRPSVSPELRLRASAFDLVDITQVIPNLCIDLRYASKKNVANQPVYPPGMPCFLRTATAQKLATAQRLLNRQGYGLCLWDAWRPPEAQIALIKAAPHPDLFMDPANDWSGHCAGVAVDVTLVNAKGKPQKMPTAYDEFSPHTGYHYQGKSAKIARNLHLLQTAMHQAGFRLLASEWWHFDDAHFVAHPTPIVFGHQLGITLPSLN